VSLTVPKLVAVRGKPKVLLDTNAVRYLFGRDGFTEEELARVRERLAQLAAADLIRVVLTTPVGWELTKFYFLPDFGPERYIEMVRFIVTVGSQWALDHEHNRKHLELVKGRRLRDSEVFNACDVEKTMAMQRDEVDVRRIFEMQKGLKDAERAKEAAVRQTAVDELAKADVAWKANLDRDLSEAWERTVKNFVKIETRRAAKDYGLRIVGAQWPKPRDMPTFWYSESFYAAKVRHVFVDSKKQLKSNSSLDSMPDMLDGTHFRDAAYADILVTQDEAFRAVAAATRLPLVVLSFDEFARALLES
jgi:hypothetical protein